MEFNTQNLKVLYHKGNKKYRIKGINIPLEKLFITSNSEGK